MLKKMNDIPILRSFTEAKKYDRCIVVLRDSSIYQRIYNKRQENRLNVKIGKFTKVKERKDKDGYLVFAYAYKHFISHRVIACAHIENYHNKKEINHIDGVKHNNSISNLEWCTRAENVKHAIDNCLANKDRNGILNRAKGRIKSIGYYSSTGITRGHFKRYLSKYNMLFKTKYIISDFNESFHSRIKKEIKYCYKLLTKLGYKGVSNE